MGLEQGAGGLEHGCMCCGAMQLDVGVCTDLQQGFGVLELCEVGLWDAGEFWSRVLGCWVSMEQGFGGLEQGFGVLEVSGAGLHVLWGLTAGFWGV